MLPIPPALRQRIPLKRRTDNEYLKAIVREWRALILDLKGLVASREITIEDFARVETRFQFLLREGVQFTAEFQLLMRALNAQARDSIDDADSDNSDFWTDPSEVDEAPFGVMEAK